VQKLFDQKAIEPSSIPALICSRCWDRSRTMIPGWPLQNANWELCRWWSNAKINYPVHSVSVQIQLFISVEERLLSNATDPVDQTNHHYFANFDSFINDQLLLCVKE
jgi:hypothetical protein